MLEWNTESVKERLSSHFLSDALPPPFVTWHAGFSESFRFLLVKSP